MLERREAARRAVDRAIGEIWLAGVFSELLSNGLRGALRDAALVFGERDQEAISNLLERLSQWQFLEDYVVLHPQCSAGEKSVSVAMDQIELEVELFLSFDLISAQLQASAA